MKHYLGICLVLLTLAAIAFFALNRCTDAAARTVANVKDAFASVLQIQPKITINQRVIMTQTAPLAELAVVTKEELATLGFDEHVEVWSIQVPLTQKKMTAEATYRLKAGFDLREPFSVSIDPVTHHVTAVMPHAKVLSVEQIGDMTLHAEDGALNRISDDERSKIVNDLANEARRAAEDSGLRKDAEDQITQRLGQLLQHNGETVEMSWDAASPAPTPVP